jgi:signal transduction histidine kinase
MAPDSSESPHVGEHMSSRVRSVSATASLHAATCLLAEHGISCLVVVDGDRPIGILSERDLVREVSRFPTAWAERPVSQVMTHPLHTTEEGATVAEAISELRRHRIRRLPVLKSDGRLAGIVTQTDLLSAAHRRLQDYATNLEKIVGERTEELRDMERRRDDLVDLTVHDIKNSLCVVDSAIQMMDEDEPGVAAMLPLLRRATHRIANLVATLLDVNRLENGSMPLRLQSVPWSVVCESILGETGLIARAKSVKVERTGETIALVRCDPQLIERVLLNLLDNAIGVAPEGSKVDVHAQCQSDGGFMVRVGNRGRVIAPDVLPTLFKKYQQGREPAPVKRFGGWGLGLTFCRLAVERHGGTIRAISPYIDNEGAALEFTIPADPK